MQKKKPINTAKIKQGSSEAFRDLFYNLYPRLVAFATRFVDDSTAEDLVQELFTSFWEKRTQIETKNITSFLFKWLQNNCLNYLKHKDIINNYKDTVLLAEERIAYNQEEPKTFKELEVKDLRKIIDQALIELPPKTQQAFRLSYLKELSHKEIAKQMNISVKTVDNHIYNAIKVLRIKMKDLFIFILMLYNIK